MDSDEKLSVESTVVNLQYERLDENVTPKVDDTHLGTSEYQNDGFDVDSGQNLTSPKESGHQADQSHSGSTSEVVLCSDEIKGPTLMHIISDRNHGRSELNPSPSASNEVDIQPNEHQVNDDINSQRSIGVDNNQQSITMKPVQKTDIQHTMLNEDTSQTDMGVSRLKTLTTRLKQNQIEGEENTKTVKEKKKVTFGLPSKGLSATSEPVKRPGMQATFGGLARTVTTITGLKKWKLKAKEDNQNSFEKYPGHLKVVQAHLRKEKTETPLTIRHEVKNEVLPILGNIVKAYKKELVGKHRLLREANFKYEKLKSELQDGFL